MSLYFHALILHPLDKGHDESISTTVSKRINLFKAGKAYALLDQALKVTSLTPAEKVAKANASSIPLDAAAQATADA
eukprot:6225989-Ditylum_brightwellii.AAC.1